MIVEVIDHATLYGLDNGQCVENKDRYYVTGQAFFVGKVAVFKGFHGALTLDDIREVVAVALKHDCQFLMAERPDESLIPRGQIIEAGPFMGWWYVVLDDLIGTKFRSIHRPNKQI
ncbi:hypothetical protein [Methylomonas koyamae]|uniref:hypothetical protein n=1 Tax=Methylomonas koyamae TaxID=702114 RepID=UPI0011287C72|nr:hypothetical protein [Methylomonas koyamae]TPQ24949.1 hypothetical protein C2U68_17385 [Methylomonas koyamae]